MRKLSVSDISYTAGLTDGEGSLRANRYMRRAGNGIRHFNYGNSLRIRFADEQTIKWLRETFAVGCVYSESNKRYQAMWNWQVNGKQCAEVLKAILPYLRTKRRQAELILKFRERIENYRQPRDARGRALPIDDEENRERLAIIEEIHRLNRPRARKEAKKKTKTPAKAICRIRKVKNVQDVDDTRWAKVEDVLGIGKSK